jgi:hypothetical protein
LMNAWGEGIFEKDIVTWKRDELFLTDVS